MSYARYPGRPLLICYDPRPPMADPAMVAAMDAQIAEKNLQQTIRVPKREARIWRMSKGQICRISLPEGSQVPDVVLHVAVQGGGG